MAGAVAGDMERGAAAEFETWRNWGRTTSCRPRVRMEAVDIEHAAAIVAGAARQDRRVKTVGSGHSFTDIACTDDVHLDIGALDGVHAVDRDSRIVTVEAGITIDRLNVALADRGLALPNLGDIDRQSIAGAVSTATHGTGRAFGNLSSAVVGMELVTGTGEVVWCDSVNNAELWRPGRVGLGALGVVTKVALQCVDAFRLRAVEEAGELDDILGDWDAFVDSADHVEFFWLPGQGRCLIKRNHRTTDPAEPSSTIRRFVEDELVENALLDGAMRIARRFPASRSVLAQLIAASISTSEQTDASHRVFCSVRRVRFSEAEFGIPIAHVPEAVDRVRALIETLDPAPLFPIEVRVSAADDIALSTAEGRETGWIAVHRYHGLPYEEYFRGVQAIVDDYGGRPHWGKIHFHDAASLRDRYPRWGEFTAARSVLDPTGTFANPYLDRVIGPIEPQPHLW